MSLSLGLEGLKTVSPEKEVEETVTVTDLLSAELVSLESQSASEKALFEAVTTARNIYNYNEILSSLKKHASVECVAFASDLVGHDVSIESAPAEQKPGLGARIVATLTKWWNDFRAFVHKCYVWVRDKVKSLISKIQLFKANATPTVSFSESRLDAIASACSIGFLENAKTASKKFNALYEAIKSDKKSTINLATEGQNYLRKAQEAQTALDRLMSKSLSLKDKDVVEAVIAMQKVNPKIQKMILKDIAVISKNLEKAKKAADVKK